MTLFSSDNAISIISAHRLLLSQQDNVGRYCLEIATKQILVFMASAIKTETPLKTK
jgi:hypothetical protein